MPRAELSQQQLDVIKIIASGGSHGRAAKMTGINKCTISLWKQRPGFRKALNEAIRSSFAESLELLQTNNKTAVIKLLEQATRDDVGGDVRAAKAFIELAFKAQERIDINQRLDDLEDRPEGKLPPTNEEIADFILDQNEDYL